MDRTIVIKDYPDISILGKDDNFVYKLELVSEDNGVNIYRFSLAGDSAASPSAVTLRWRIPKINMKGVWKCGAIHDKRQQYDWELIHLQSRISVDAPIISVFGHDDTNGITFACSDAVNLVEMNALLREEDNHEYCHFTFFSERHPEITHYETDIRIDTRRIPYYNAIQEVSKWWESFEACKPCQVPALAKAPLYSTWYNFHQDLDEEVLIKECQIAYEAGYELIILDDGWQTMDNNRGYDYTGDWKPDRFPNTAEFVKRIHDTGMKIGFWYSVPFCGKNSEAYQRFKGKFLTENHRWAPVFDPRYPDVRAYLIEIYASALRDWNLDGFKLDFIDDFRVYPETELTLANGRDYANVNEAVGRLLTDVMTTLKTIKSDIVVEFRQQYIGPVMRKFGNMFRAFDCPNDPVSNRIRITDVKLLCGDSAVHSDMITWHKDESVERAANQVLNAFFAVPQMSVLLAEESEDKLNMISFYTQYWKEVSGVVLSGEFSAYNSLSNYPMLKSEKDGHAIYGLYDKLVLDIDQDQHIDILNAHIDDKVVIRNLGEGAEYDIVVYNCMGDIVLEELRILESGLSELDVPVSGLARLVKV